MKTDINSEIVFNSQKVFKNTPAILCNAIMN